MGKPKLFVGLDGPMLVPSEGHDRDSFLGAALASYAKPFMHWATQHFDVHWLSDRGPVAAAYVTQLLGLPADSVHIAGFLDSKVEALKHHKDFYWVDSELIPDEVSWLAQHGHVGRFITVDPFTGVSTDAKKALETRVVNHR